MSVKNVRTVLFFTAAFAAVILPGSGASAQVTVTQTGQMLDKNMQVGSGGYNTVSGGQGGVNSQLYVSGAVTGQVARIQTGQALDRNLQLGSGGYNAVTGGSGGVNRQLFINRQVQGLGLFRGDVPYYKLRTLAAKYPTFKTKVGIPLNTLTDTTLGKPIDITLDAIEKGAISSLRHQLIEPTLARQLYVNATSDYASIARIQPSQGISAVVPLISNGSGASYSASRNFAPSRPGASALFGVSSAGDRKTLADEFRQLPLDYRMYKPADDSDKKKGRGIAPAEKKGAFGENIIPPDGKPTIDDKLPTVDQDIFLDILIQLQKRRSLTASPQPTTAPADEEASLENIVKFAAVDGTITVQALAGKRESKFNTYLAKGQKLLKNGKYYNAAEYFELASISKPNNPLARVGWGLSLLGAGEPLAAAMRFRSAIEVFPPLMETRFDLEKMTNAEELRNRLSEVHVRINSQREDSAMLTFLAVYLHLNAGRTLDCQFYAEKLKATCGDDRILKAYAEFALTGKKPGR